MQNMIRAFLAFVLLSFAVATGSIGEKQTEKFKVAEKVQPGHFQGSGVLVYNEILREGNNFLPCVEKAKANGVNYVLVKAFDGREWGVPNDQRKFRTQLNQKMIDAFHEAGIKCYGYGTTWLYSESNVDEAARHAINILHKTNADGVIFDDVFAYGSDEKQTEKLFSAVRGHIESCDHCRGKALGFSTFPYVWRKELPWHIPLKYADCYMPQIYWPIMKKTPAGAVDLFQKSWVEYQKTHKDIRARIVPVATTVEVSARQIEEFISSVRSAGYEDLLFFRFAHTSAKEWEVIRNINKKNASL